MILNSPVSNDASFRNHVVEDPTATMLAKQIGDERHRIHAYAKSMVCLHLIPSKCLIHVKVPGTCCLAGICQDLYGSQTRNPATSFGCGWKRIPRLCMTGHHLLSHLFRVHFWAVGVSGSALGRSAFLMLIQSLRVNVLTQICCDDATLL